MSRNELVTMEKRNPQGQGWSDAQSEGLALIAKEEETGEQQYKSRSSPQTREA